MCVQLTIFRKGLILISLPLLYQLFFIGLLAYTVPRDKAAEAGFLRTKEVLRQAQVVLTNLVDAETGKAVTYELVIPDMADFSKGLVSVTSPIGKALVGHRAGEEVTIKTPASTRVYEIAKLATVHDKASR